MKDNKTKHTKIYDGSNKEWIVEPIGKVCEFEKGKKPKNTGPHSDTRTVPYINIKAFETGTPEEYAEAGNYPACSKDDVLIVWDGARAGLIGRGVAGYIGSTLSKVWSEATNNKYLFYFLKSQYNYINTNTKGVGIPHVDPNILYAIELPIAPKKIQKLIVSEIEKQFSRLDEAVAALKRIKANLKRYKASVLKAAVEGKLTEEWLKEHPDVEPAGELLKRILVERRKKWEEDYIKKYVAAHGDAPKDDSWKKKYKEPAALDTAKLQELPKGWVWATIEQLATKVQYGSSAKTNKNTAAVPVLRMGNIFEGRLRLDDLKYLPQDHSEFPELLLKEGDLLFNRTNSPELVGKSAVYLGKPHPCSFASYLIRVQFSNRVSSRHISFYVNSTYGRSWIKAVVSQQVGQANVNGTKLQSLSIPLPSHAEQQKIIEEVERCLSVAEEIEAAVEANLKRAQRLRQSILKKAFSGKACAVI